MLIFHGMLRSENFGDTLMAEIVVGWLRELTDSPIRTMFADPRLRRRLGLEPAGPFDLLTARAAVLSGGGYFQIADSGLPPLKRFVKNAGPILLAQTVGVPSALLGIGVGRMPSRVLEAGVRRLFTKSEVACVRDHIGFEAARRVAPSANVVETADLVFTLHPDRLPQSAHVAADRLAPRRGERRQTAVLLSNTPDRDARYRSVVDALEDAAVAQPDRHVMLIEDHVTAGSGQQRIQALLHERLGPDRSSIVPYPGSWKLAALLARMDSVLTDKLHVALVAAALGAEPYSIAKHPKNLAAFASLDLENNVTMLSERSTPRYGELATRAFQASAPFAIADDVRRKAWLNRDNLSAFLTACGLAPLSASSRRNDNDPQHSRLAHGR